MKFTILNGLLLLVAIAAIVGWRTDKSRFETAIANYGEVVPESNSTCGEIYNCHHLVLASFSIGDIAFVVLQNDASPIKDPISKLSEVDHPTVAERKARPSPEIMTLINEYSTMESRLSFEDAAVFDLGDDGLSWEINWSLLPINAAKKRMHPRYTGYLRGDGARVEPRIFLRDSFGSFYSNDEPIYSVISINSLAPAKTEAPDESALVELAESTLNRTLQDLELEIKFQFESIERREFSGKLKDIPINERLEVWGVTFVDQAIPKSVKNLNPATRITVWVTGELQTSKITLGYWEVLE